MSNEQLKSRLAARAASGWGIGAEALDAIYKLERELTQRDDERVELLRRAVKAERELAQEHSDKMAAVCQAENLCRELAQAREDAERYRWLRDFLDPEDYYSKWPRWTVAVESGGSGQIFRGEKLDAAIDTARNAAQAAQNAAGQMPDSCASDGLDLTPAKSSAPAAPEADAQDRASTLAEPQESSNSGQSAKPASSALVLMPRDVVVQALKDCVESMTHFLDATTHSNAVGQARTVLLMLSAAPASGPSEEAVKLAKKICDNGARFDDEATAEASALLLSYEILRLHGGKP